MAAGRQIVIPYAPRRPFVDYHARTQRFAIGAAHRRCGKTVAAVNDIIRRAITSRQERYRAAYIAPYLNQAKDIAWTYLKHYSQPLWGHPPNESELWVELLNGARIRIYGADNPDRLRGGYLDDATLDEYADMAPGVWGAIIRPMLADRQGTAAFIGTPKGKNGFWELFDRAKTDPEWFRFFLPASQTGILPQSELDAARRDMTPEQFDQEFECSFEAAILGSYYGRDMAEATERGRICDVPIDDHAPVHTAWDLGVGDSMVLWFWQAIGPEIRLVDYYEASGYGIDHYAAVKREKGYKPGVDYVPHDARQRSITSTGRDGKAKQRVEVMIECGLNPFVIPIHRIEDGISAVRQVLPRCYFDERKTTQGVEALRQYQREYDEKKRVFDDKPLHNWASHPADAFRTLAMAWKSELAGPAKPAPIPNKLEFLAQPDGTVRPNLTVRQIVEAKMRAKARN